MIALPSLSHDPPCPPLALVPLFLLPPSPSGDRCLRLRRRRLFGCSHCVQHLIRSQIRVIECHSRLLIRMIHESGKYDLMLLPA